MSWNKFIGWLLWQINRSICSTLKYKVSNEPAGQSLFALWHGQSFPLFFWGQHRKLCILPVKGWRGDAIEYLAKKYKYKTVRFLEAGTPLERSKSLEQLIQTIKERCDAAIAVDGPPKPLVYHRAKSGILYLSQKMGLPIAPAGIKIKRKISLLWRWDRYELPLPWSEVEIRFGKPFIATEKTTIQELEEEIDRLSSEFQSGED